jgi:hypothetical protein
MVGAVIDRAYHPGLVLSDDVFYLRTDSGRGGSSLNLKRSSTRTV